VDLESGAVAEQARLAGVPFAALRVICDPASATLPPAALVALSGEGAIVLLRVAGDVVRQPSQLPALLRLGRDAGRARAALLRHCAALKPLLA
jgi:adenosylhomocysteine nucleosidase